MISYPIRPKGHRVLIKLEKAEVKTKGGLYLPSANVDKAQFNKTRGEVVAMGDTCYNRPEFGDEPWCKVGDIVFVSKDIGMFIPFGEGDDECLFKICNDEDVVGEYIVEESVENV